MRPTRYDPAISASYGKLFSRQSHFNWLAELLEKQALAMLPQERDIAILDVACGTGSFCRAASGHGYRDVVGVDLSPSQIETCRALGEGPGLSFLVGDARDLRELRGRFDVVNASWLYDTAVNQGEAARMAREVRSCLKPGGRHQGMEINFQIRASGADELDTFGIALMPDQPPGTRPEHGQLIRADIDAGLGPEGRDVITTFVTFFDEPGLTIALQQGGFRSVRYILPDLWDLSQLSLSGNDRSRFERYVALNPEMIAFRAA